MSGVLFPDFLGTLSKAASFESNRAQTDYLNEDRAAKAEIAPLIPKALQGDKEALNQIGARHPDTFTKLMPMLQSMETNQRAKLKETSDWTTRAAMGVLSLPENERPAAYQAALADGQRLGYKIDMPPQYDRAVEGRLKHILNQARPIADYWKNQGENVQYTDAGGGGGAAPPSAGGGVNPYNIGNVRPVGGGPNSGFQQPASLDDGIRLAVNNVKAYPAKFNGGQPMTLMQIGARWAPAGDGANDPGQWARNVASIGGLDPNKPLDMNDPATAAAFARGVHGAEHGANKVLPPQAYVQAITGGAQPPGLAQGDAAPRADASGNPLPPQGNEIPREATRGVQLPPGYRIGTQGGKIFSPVPGYIQVMPPGGGAPVLWPVPQAKQTPAGYRFAPDGNSLQAIPGGPADKPQGTGPFTGKSPEAEGLNMLVATGVLTPRQAAELAAGKTVTDPETKQIIFMTPSGIFGQNPGQAPQPLAAPPAPGVAAPQGGAPMPSAGGPPAGVPAPAAPAAAPPNSGAIPLTGTKTTGQPSATEMANLRSARVEFEKINGAAEDFKTEWKNATPAERARTLSGAPTPLAASYYNFALLAKGDVLYKLGVLNGPDLTIIQKALADPSTWKSLFATDNDVIGAVDKALNIVKTGISATEKGFGIAPSQPQAGQGNQTAKPGTYTGPDNAPISWPEIEDTAKKRGITPDDVVRRLGLKPTGMQ